MRSPGPATHLANIVGRGSSVSNALLAGSSEPVEDLSAGRGRLQNGGPASTCYHRRTGTRIRSGLGLRPSLHRAPVLANWRTAAYSWGRSRCADAHNLRHPLK